MPADGLSPDYWRKPRPRLTLWIERKLDEGWTICPFTGYLAGRMVLAAGFLAFSAVARYPLAALLIITVLAGSVIAWEWARRARARQVLIRQIAGLCLSCAYDLRASPDRCPECGRPRAADGVPHR